jgi:hypothetical protein
MVRKLKRKPKSQRMDCTAAILLLPMSWVSVLAPSCQNPRRTSRNRHFLVQLAGIGSYTHAD